MEMLLPPGIGHDQRGFAYLAWLNAQVQSCVLDTVIINMENTNWFDADMCAVLGAILHKVKNNANAVKIMHIQTDVEKALSRNGFLSSYGRWKPSDRYGTTIAYRRFNRQDARLFAEYIVGEFIGQQRIPQMSPDLLRVFTQSVLEIFDNSVLHSYSDLGVFSCGQFFRKRESLTFTIDDLGVGIQRNVKNRLRLEQEITPEQAIVWAVQDYNTTWSKVPGGLGLTILRKFIDLNEGRLQIVSDAGYWQRASSSDVIANLGNPFPGTVVSIEINTADSKAYRLVA